MYKKIQNICSKPKVFAYYTTETLWNDPHISKHMLELHLNESVDPASRKKEFVDKSVNWITNHFNLTAGKSVCDFGCGPGLYTTQFAETGASVTGIDFSNRSIEYAKNMAGKQNLNIEYIRQNYLDFSSDKRFDLITMIYCDFCVLNPDQRKTLLGIFNKHLAPGGAILLDVFSMAAYEGREETTHFEHNFMNGFWSPKDYYCFMNTFKYETEKVVLDKYTIMEPGKEWTAYNWLQYFDFETLKNEFAESGLKIVAAFDNVAGAEYTGKKPEIAVIAQKA